MFKTDADKQMLKLNRVLRSMSDNGIPDTVSNTLNNMAFLSRTESVKLFERDRVIRSDWTKRGMRFEQSKKGIPIRDMESRSGNIRDYAITQEVGENIKPEREYIPVPALAARIGKNKRKRIAKKFSMPRLKNLRRLPNVGGFPKRRFAAMLNIARKEKQFGPFVITEQDAGGFKLPVGIFNLSAHGRMRRGGGKVTMIRKLKRQVRVPGKPFIKPAAVKIGSKMDAIYINQAKRLLKRKFGRDIR